MDDQERVNERMENIKELKFSIIEALKSGMSMYEYLNELFLSIHGTILFTLDNQDDRSFLLEDENDFSNDLFYTYFVV